MLHRLPFLVVPLLLSATLAHAVTLVTPSVSASGDDTLDCRIVNAGDKSISVFLELVQTGPTISGLTGTPFVFPSDTQDLPPNSAYSVFNRFAVELFPDGNTAHCRFTGKFSKTSVRAAAEVRDEKGRTVAIAPAE